MTHAHTGCSVISAMQSLHQACDSLSLLPSHGSGSSAPWESAAIYTNVVDGQEAPHLNGRRHVPTASRYSRPQIILISAILWSIMLL
jgi:hypothetical protein